MDLIEYANKFLELHWLIKAVYGGTEEGVYISKWDPPKYTIYADIPNRIEWRSGIYKPSNRHKGYIPGYVPDVYEGLMEIGYKYLSFGFWLDDDKKYHVDGFEY